MAAYVLLNPIAIDLPSFRRKKTTDKSILKEFTTNKWENYLKLLQNFSPSTADFFE